MPKMDGSALGLYFPRTHVLINATMIANTNTAKAINYCFEKFRDTVQIYTISKVITLWQNKNCAYFITIFVFHNVRPYIECPIYSTL